MILTIELGFHPGLQPNILGFQIDVQYDPGIIAFPGYLNDIRDDMNKRSKNFPLPYNMLNGSVINDRAY